MKNDLNALYLRRNDLWNSQPHCNLGDSAAVKAAYRAREEEWLAKMHEIDSLIAAARKEAA